MAWLQTGIAACSLAIDGLLFVLLLGHHPPSWVILMVLIFNDAVFSWRLVTLISEPKEGPLMINSPFAKAIVAAIVTSVTAGLIAAEIAIPMTSTAHGWVTVAIAVLGGVGGTTAAVYQVRNAPMTTQPSPSDIHV